MNKKNPPMNNINPITTKKIINAFFIDYIICIGLNKLYLYPHIVPNLVHIIANPTNTEIKTIAIEIGT